MKILHLLKSEPNETVELFIDAMTIADHEATVEPLYAGKVDWERLVDEIFKSDRVISWW